jgi:Domain of unknown function (DUF4184)
MPFPLAHPAAVLPLRRYCPGRLNLAALVIGSLTPDASYCLGEKAGGSFGHGLLGSVVFCLPVGLVMVALFYGLRAPVVRMLPAPYPQAFLPLCQRPLGSLWVVVISLLIGAWTHILWDSFTHNDGWFVQHLPVLQSVVLSVAGRTARVCHLLWYGCSFAGMIWLFLVFEKWKQACVNRGAGAPSKAVLRDAVLVTLLVLPIALAHHLVRGNKPWLLLIAALCALPVLGVMLKMGKARK